MPQDLDEDDVFDDIREIAGMKRVAVAQQSDCS
jgi:hypothetical protein